MKFELNAGMVMRPRHVPPSAWIGHIPFAAWLVNALAPEVLVELGTHHGTSYLAFCQAVDEAKLPTKCFAVDTWEGDEHAGDYPDQVFTELHGIHQAHYADFSQLMRMTFDLAVDYFDDSTVDLLHIDGLHTYEAVRHDFETWLPKLSERAIVLFHDTCVRERGFGVWKFFAEIRKSYPSYEFEHTHGLGVLAVGEGAAPLVGALRGSGDADAKVLNQLFERLGRQVNDRHDVEVLRGALHDSHRKIASLGEASSQLAAGMSTRDEQLRSRDLAVGEVLQRIDALRLEFIQSQGDGVLADLGDRLQALAEDRSRDVEAIEARFAALTASQAELARNWQSSVHSMGDRIEVLRARQDQVHMDSRSAIDALGTQIGRDLSDALEGVVRNFQASERSLRTLFEDQATGVRMAQDLETERVQALDTALERVSAQIDSIVATLHTAEGRRLGYRLRRAFGIVKE